MRSSEISYTIFLLFTVIFFYSKLIEEKSSQNKIKNVGMTLKGEVSIDGQKLHRLKECSNDYVVTHLLKFKRLEWAPRTGLYPFLKNVPQNVLFFFFLKYVRSPTKCGIPRPGIPPVQLFLQL